jgi:hypothetical protein
MYPTAAPTRPPHAQALAEHIRQEAPADAQVTAEPAGVRLPFIAF